MVFELRSRNQVLIALRKAMRFSIGLVAVGFALAVGCGSSDSGDDGFIAPDFSEFDAQVDAFLSANDLAGASVVVVHEDHGVLHSEAYGEHDAGRTYAIASSSKILSVGVLMKLMDDGLLDIDEPIGTYVGEMFGSGRSNLTLAQMVSNSSGLISLADNPAYPPYFCQYQTAGSVSACAETIYSAEPDGMSREPDSGFHYGGAQWQLAGGVAEIVSGKSWDTLIEETYVDPCGVSSLGYTNAFASSGLGYPEFMNDVSRLPTTENFSIEGGAYVTADDYAELLLMHLRGGRCGENRVLSEDAVSRMQQDRIQEVYGGSTGSDLEGYGLGWWIDRDLEGVVADPGAYGAFPYLDTERGFGIFIALESESGTGAELALELQPILDGLIENL